MSYATRQAMIDRYGATLYQILDVDDGADLSGNTPLARSLADANAEVDSYLRGQYTLPLSSVPDQLVRHACSIARYLLLSDRRQEALSETDTKAYDAAISYLRSVARGDARLTVPEQGTFTSESVPEAISVGTDADTGSTASWMEGF